MMKHTHTEEQIRELVERYGWQPSLDDVEVLLEVIDELVTETQVTE